MSAAAKFFLAAAALLLARASQAASSKVHRVDLDDAGLADVSQPVPLTNTFESVSSKVNALSSRLAQDELYRKQRLAAKEGALRKKLEQAQMQNHQAAETNARTFNALQELTRENNDLRSRAVSLQHDTKQMRKDLAVVQANLSTVLEFTSSSLSASSKADPALAILDHLARQDAVSNTEEEHAHRMLEVANARTLESLRQGNEPVSLLQVQSKGQSVPNPKNLLSALDLGLTELAQEYEARERRLKAMFAEKLHKEQARYAALLSERENLSAAMEKQRTLQQQLQAAVKVLEDRLAKLQEQSRSVRMYVQRLGNRGMPFISSSREIDLEVKDEGANSVHIEQPEAKSQDSLEDVTAQDAVVVPIQMQRRALAKSLAEDAATQEAAEEAAPAAEDAAQERQETQDSSQAQDADAAPDSANENGADGTPSRWLAWALSWRK